jgi:hypothetical protein
LQQQLQKQQRLEKRLLARLKSVVHVLGVRPKHKVCIDRVRRRKKEKSSITTSSSHDTESITQFIRKTFGRCDSSS